MAKPIRNTPILAGRDAATFRAELASVPDKIIRAKERQRLKDNVAKLRLMIAQLPH